MFPFVQFSKRPWLGSTLLLGCLVVISLTHQLPSPNATPPYAVTYIEEMEAHLTSKAAEVVERFTSEPYSIDLCLELDTAQTTTTTYLPGEKILVANQEESESLCSQKWELTGTWTESTDVRPKIKTIRCCVTLPKGEGIDHDHLYRRLSYALGVSLERGDLLQIVEI